MIQQIVENSKKSINIKLVEIKNVEIKNEISKEIQ